MSADRKRIVTIDGPSGGGKSTVSRALAARLDFTYLDTGAMYRAVAFQCRELQVSPEESDRLERLLAEIRIELLPPAPGGDDVRVVLNGREVGHLLRTPEMAMLASCFSALAQVRASLTRLSQEIGAAGRIVAEGRDTGTVVFPEAAWKFFLDASPEVRAERRAAQLRSKGEVVDEAALLAQIIKRDRDDRDRAIAPLKPADDAILIDSSALSAVSVVELMEKKIRSSRLAAEQA